MPSVSRNEAESAAVSSREARSAASASRSVRRVPPPPHAPVSPRARSAPAPPPPRRAPRRLSSRRARVGGVHLGGGALLAQRLVRVRGGAQFFRHLVQRFLRALQLELRLRGRRAPLCEAPLRVAQLRANHAVARDTRRRRRRRLGARLLQLTAHGVQRAHLRARRSGVRAGRLRSLGREIGAPRGLLRLAARRGERRAERLERRVGGVARGARVVAVALGLVRERGEPARLSLRRGARAFAFLELRREALVLLLRRLLPALAQLPGSLRPGFGAAQLLLDVRPLRRRRGALLRRRLELGLERRAPLLLLLQVLLQAVDLAPEPVRLARRESTGLPGFAAARAPARTDAAPFASSSAFASSAFASSAFASSAFATASATRASKSFAIPSAEDDASSAASSRSAAVFSSSRSATRGSSSGAEDPSAVPRPGLDPGTSSETFSAVSDSGNAVATEVAVAAVSVRVVAAASAASSFVSARASRSPPARGLASMSSCSAGGGRRPPRRRFRFALASIGGAAASVCGEKRTKAGSGGEHRGEARGDARNEPPSGSTPRVRVSAASRSVRRGRRKDGTGRVVPCRRGARVADGARLLPLGHVIAVHPLRAGGRPR